METKQYALITGGTSGIGLELARLFAKDKYNLIIVARDEQELANTAAELQQSGIEVITIAKDLFKRQGAFDVYDEVKAKGIEISILVNDAGQGQYGKFIDNDIDRELDIIHLNICALVTLTKLFLKDMVSRGQGRILNLSSVASKTPGPWQAVYHGTKAFVQSFTEAVREEVKETGVTLTALLPGATQTDFFNKADMLEAKNVKGKELDDPAKVALDGYEALMNGDDKVISGFMNKVQVAATNMMTDSAAAAQVAKQQQPADSSKN